MKDLSFKTIFKKVFTTHYSIPFTLCFIGIIGLIIIMIICPKVIDNSITFEKEMANTEVNVKQFSVYCSEIVFLDNDDLSQKKVYFKDLETGFSTNIITTDDYFVGREYFANIYTLKNKNNYLGVQREIDILPENTIPSNISQRKEIMVQEKVENKIKETKFIIPLFCGGIMAVIFSYIILKMLELFDDMSFELKKNRL